MLRSLHLLFAAAGAFHAVGFPEDAGVIGVASFHVVEAVAAVVESLLLLMSLLLLASKLTILNFEKNPFLWSDKVH